MTAPPLLLALVLGPAAAQWRPAALPALPAPAAAPLPPLLAAPLRGTDVLPDAPLSGPRAAPPAPIPPARAWPEADRLFRRDPRWLGADGASSVRLGRGRLLWLFGDSFVDEAGSGDRRRAGLVRNSVGVSEGRNPATASMEFAWGGAPEAPEAFFKGREEGEFLWPGHGARLGGGLLLFFLRMRSTGAGPFDFETAGWTAFLVENPDAPLGEWRRRELAVPSAPDATPGTGGVLVRDGWLYAYATTWPGHALKLARWRAAEAAAGDLSRPEWRTASGWGRPEEAVLVLADGEPDGSVHRDRLRGDYVMTQTAGFAPAVLVERRAPRPEGPWSEPAELLVPEEAPRSDALVYAGKAHPGLRGGAATYATNAVEPERLLREPTLYYPRVVRLRK